MSNPVSSTTASTALPTPTNPSPRPTPIGVGASSSSITPPDTDPSKTDYWESIKGYAASFSEFLRNLVLGAVEGIRSALGAVAGWFGSSAAETPAEPSVNWELPAETTQQRPTPQAHSPVADPFSDLPITSSHRQKIYTLIHTMGTTSAPMLLFKKAELEQIGVDIQNVHPLKFLDYIFRHPSLPRDMASLAESSLKWNPFVGGLSEKLRREASTLPGCKTGFARSLNVSLSDLEPFFARSDWDGLVKFLIDVKTGKKTSVWAEPAPTPGATTTTITPPPTPNPVTTTIVPLTTTTGSGATTTDLTAATTTTAAAGITLTPPQLLHISDLPFDADDDRILTALVTNYAEHRRAWLLWNRSALNLQWDHLGARHPLKLLAALYSKPALMTHIQTLSSYWGTKSLFMGALTHQLGRLPIVQVRPYIDDFANVCGLDANRTKVHIETGNWNQVVEDLMQSHLARA
ncbi:MAG: hypothetical protein JSS60_04940 [Verrucomicrobia bacterium]|nr:hypothetical protein [Verrucomicrobiota bacterium]